MSKKYSDPIEDYKLRNETNISQQEIQHEEVYKSRIISSTEFVKQFRNDVWIIKNVIPKSELGEIFGASGSRKTFMALDMALCIHNGLSWHGHDVKQGNVLYICGEGVNGVRKRLSAMMAHYNVENAVDILPVSIDMMSDESMKQLSKDIELIDKQYTMIVVDTLNANFAGGEDSADDFGDMKRNLLKHICSKHTMVTWVHHTGNTEGKRSRGTSARYAGIDVSIQVSKNEKYSTLTNTKQKEAEEFAPLTFSFKSVPSAFCEDDGTILHSIVPQLDTEVKQKTTVATPKFNDEIKQGIRLAVKAGKSSAPTKDFEAKYNLVADKNRVVHIEDARKFAYKEFVHDNKTQAFNRWISAAKKANIAYFYDDFILLANDAKLTKLTFSGIK